MVKKHRRRREHGYMEPDPSRSAKGCRVHDFLKGWGNIFADGSVLWDWYIPPTKREKERTRRLIAKWRNKPPTKVPVPMIRQLFPELLAKDIVGVQPLTGETPGFQFKIKNDDQPTDE